MNRSISLASTWPAANCWREVAGGVFAAVARGRTKRGGAHTRADRAAAEAVMMVEVVGESDFWTEVKDRMRIS